MGCKNMQSVNLRTNQYNSPILKNRDKRNREKEREKTQL